MTWLISIALWIVLVGGAWAAGADTSLTIPGVLSRADADNSGRIAHAFSWELEQGQTVIVRLSAAFDGYLELLTEDGRLVSADDDSGGGMDALLEYTTETSGMYRLVVSSAAQDETGPYTLGLHTASHASDGEVNRWPTRLHGKGVDRAPAESLRPGTVLQRRLERPGEIATFAINVVDLADSGGLFDIWLLGESDFDLHATAIGMDPLRPLAESASEGPFGYEHIRIAAGAGTQSIQLQVVLYGNLSHDGTYYLLAQELTPGVDTSIDQTGGPPMPSVSEPQAQRSRVVSPLGGAIVPGSRRSGAVNTREYATQFWTLMVPEGVRRVSVGLFGAEGDLDLSLHPGWSPGPAGFGHDVHRVSKRHNERIHLGSPDGDGYVPPGPYTVAVWADEPWPSTYQIEVSFDAPLPSSLDEAFEPPAGMELTGVQQAQLATVLIENDFNTGSGALVTPDGLILTNFHVVAACHASGESPVGCLEPKREEPLQAGNVDSAVNAMEHIISLLDPRTGRATQRFTARLAQAFPQYDLALLEITADIDGRPWPPSPPSPAHELPYVPLYSSNSAGSDEHATSLSDLDTLTLGYEVGEAGVRFVSTPTRIGEELLWEGRPVLVHIKGGRNPWPSGGLVVEAATGHLLAMTTARHHRGFGLELLDPQHFAHPIHLVTEALPPRVREPGEEVPLRLSR